MPFSSQAPRRRPSHAQPRLLVWFWNLPISSIRLPQKTVCIRKDPPRGLAGFGWVCVSRGGGVLWFGGGSLRWGLSGYDFITFQKWSLSFGVFDCVRFFYCIFLNALTLYLNLIFYNIRMRDSSLFRPTCNSPTYAARVWFIAQFVILATLPEVRQCCEYFFVLPFSGVYSQIWHWPSSAYFSSLGIYPFFGWIPGAFTLFCSQLIYYYHYHHYFMWCGLAGAHCSQFEIIHKQLIWAGHYWLQLMFCTYDLCCQLHLPF